MLEDFYNGKRVFITGHTGFKGSWLSEWLLLLGGCPEGYSLEPATDPALFKQLDLANRMKHNVGDIRHIDSLTNALKAAQPDVIFHLAAQSLVRESYLDPVTTYQTNVLGTVNLFDTIRSIGKPCSVVVITSDKCYENREWLWGYRENDPLGGHDPYSSSKACAELVVQSYRRSFFSLKTSNMINVASARAGNVIGGGDWASNRILPDCVRALAKNQSISVRNPSSTRPWQHVLEPLYGYLLLGQAIHPSNGNIEDRMCTAFNFGPTIESNRSVESVVEIVCKYWLGEWKDKSDPMAPHEARMLNLSIDKAWHLLNWRPVWDFETSIRETIQWYRYATEDAKDSKDIVDFTRRQISDYCGHIKIRNDE